MATFQAIREWLQVCTTHTNCLKAFERGNSTVFNRGPTRLVFVGSSNVGSVKIVSPNSNVKYAALSYCWGGDDSMKLTRAKLDTWQRAITVSQLPRTIQDAIISTRFLGLEYLWVDRLCIIQYDPANIHKEIAAMPEIYQRATLTISASSAKSSDEGFLHTSTVTYQKLDRCLVVLRYRCPDKQYGRVVLARQRAQDDPVDRRSPIDRRAWTLQEDMLSIRIIRFGLESIQWGCRCSSTRCWHNGIEIKTETWGKDEFIQLRYISFEWKWSHIVKNYTQRELGVPADKLLAISAVAQDISRDYGQQTTRYLAGIWQHELPKALM